MPTSRSAAFPESALVTHPLMTREPTGIALGSGCNITDIFLESFFCSSSVIASRTFGSTFKGAVAGTALVIFGHACVDGDFGSANGSDGIANLITTAFGWDAPAAFPAPIKRPQTIIEIMLRNFIVAPILEDSLTSSRMARHLAVLRLVCRVL